LDKNDIKVHFAPPYSEFTKDGKVILRVKYKKREKIVMIDTTISDPIIVKSFEEKIMKDLPEWILVKVP